MTAPRPDPTPPSGSSRTLVVTLGVVVVILVVAIAAIVGYLVLGRSADSGFPTGASPTPTGPATTSAAVPEPSEFPSSVRPSATRTTGTPDTPTTDDAGPTVAGAPDGSTPCPVRYGRTGLYRASSVGSSVTSCGFAEEVREAYAQSGRPGQLPRTVSAVSPENGVRYTMSCAAQRSIVTCTGGDDAVVYLYR